MIYNLADKYERKRAEMRFNELLEVDCIIDLKKKFKARTTKQNKYLHSLFALYGIEFGLTLNESKQQVKSVCPFMTYEKGADTYLRSTADLDTKEMTEFIEWFRNYAAMNGCYLPSADEYNGKWNYFENIIENAKQFL